MSYYFVILILLVFGVFIAVITIKKDYRKRNFEANREIEKLKNQYNLLQNSFLQVKEKYEESEVLARIVRQSPNAIMLMDKDGYIQWINSGFERMYEYNYSEFTCELGTNYRQTSFSPDVESRLKFRSDSKQPFRYEALNITKNKKRLWTQTALVPIFNENGEIANFVTIDADIHQRVDKSDKLVAEMELMSEKIDFLTTKFKHFESDFFTLFSNMDDLFELIQSTDQMLQFIKSISSETRILGLNASIEAGRAGEQGHGFRVITNVIVDISKKTIQSVKEITDILDSIKKKEGELLLLKKDSVEQMISYHELISNLKHEVEDIETSITEFKSLT